MKRRIGLSILFIFFSAAALAQLHFPALTGRVVDDAHVLSARTAQALGEKLADYERGTTNQVVVATLPSLQGTSIEDYGYQLGRYWRLGQKGKDNGVVLIVAPHERKVRIEVGYGLEPVLTDAASSKIVYGVILPAFKSGDMESGIVAGTDAILSVLGGKGIPATESAKEASLPGLINVVIILFLLILFVRHPSFLLAMMLNDSFRSGGSSFRDSGWSGGGGGSFGGGGASGSW